MMDTVILLYEQKGKLKRKLLYFFVYLYIKE